MWTLLKSMPSASRQRLISVGFSVNTSNLYFFKAILVTKKIKSYHNGENHWSITCFFLFFFNRQARWVPVLNTHCIDPAYIRAWFWIKRTRRELYVKNMYHGTSSNDQLLCRQITNWKMSNEKAMTQSKAKHCREKWLERATSILSLVTAKRSSRGPHRKGCLSLS